MGTTSNLFGGGKLQKTEFLASGQFTVPGGVYLIEVDGIAAGAGAGSGAGSSSRTGGSGGESGQHVFNFPIPVTPGEVLDIEIGAAGTGGPAQVGAGDGNDATDGGDTIIRRGSDVLLRLRGGKKGRGGTTNDTPGGETTGIVVQAPFGRGLKGGDSIDSADAEAGESCVNFDSGTPGVADAAFGGGASGGASPWGAGGDGTDGNASGTSNSGGTPADNTGAGGGGSGCGAGNSNPGGDGSKGRLTLKYTQ